MPAQLNVDSLVAKAVDLTDLEDLGEVPYLEPDERRSIVPLLFSYRMTRPCPP